MESRMSKSFKVAVIGSDLLGVGFKLAGVTRAFNPESQAQAENTLREQLQNEDVGIIVISTKVVRMIRDRKLQEAITSSVMPLIVEIPDYGEQEQQVDTLRRLIIRAIGLDIEKNR